MSSYLSIYLVPKRKDKEEEKQYISLISYSRSSDIYTVFNENVNPAFAGSENPYTTLTKAGMKNMLTDVRKDRDKALERLKLYETYAKDNPDYIEEIIAQRELIEDYETTLSALGYISDIVEETSEGYNGFEEVCCNID